MTTGFTVSLLDASGKSVDAHAFKGACSGPSPTKSVRNSAGVWTDGVKDPETSSCTGASYMGVSNDTSNDSY